MTQEDEEEIARRKQKEEEETVDIVSMDKPSSLKPTVSLDSPWALDGESDFAWADEDPDEDNEEWKLKIFMEADDDGDF
jgi:COMPASS component SWD1